ncbi:MAG: 16S rRNA processing protein RimM [Bacilli bacterium]|nr:16S rRNA processing protein RimM [Bacilli bacterium]
MEFINIGKIVNTHGIKGELRILSDFRHKDKVFKVGMKFYVGREKEEFIVNSYRFHKIFDMVTFKGFNNINDVLYLKGRQVFINKEDLVLDDGEIYIEDLIGYEVFIGDKNIGKVTDIIFNPKANDVLKVGDILIPYVKNLIIKIEDNKIYYTEIGGLV